jgi:FkbM family methyltransferase
MKSLIKKLIKSLPFDFSLNQKYDTQTRLVIRKHCNENSNCIDVGCHKGEIMDLFIQQSPNGHHIGFEPIPDLFEKLQLKYASSTNCRVSNIALSNIKGTTSFNYVISNPAYSGLVKRKYDRPEEQDTQIEVATDKLDDVLPSDYAVDLIKIDVEGGEMLVLGGAEKTLLRAKPIVIFEHGLGASECYGTTPAQVFDFFQDCGYKITTMKNWLDKKQAFSKPEFENQYYSKINYYFLAYP